MGVYVMGVLEVLHGAEWRKCTLTLVSESAGVAMRSVPLRRGVLSWHDMRTAGRSSDQGCGRKADSAIAPFTDVAPLQTRRPSKRGGERGAGRETAAGYTGSGP